MEESLMQGTTVTRSTISFLAVLGVVFLAASFECYGGPSSREPLSGRAIGDLAATRADVQSALGKIRGASDAELLERLMRCEAEDVPLSKLHPSCRPEYWINKWACMSVLEVLWAAAGMHEAHEADGGSFRETSQASAQDCLFRASAFDELRRRKDKRIWHFLVSRLPHPPTILDLCVVGGIMWGPKTFALVPFRDKVVRSSGDSPLPRPEWTLPAATAERWRALLRGKNGVYRWLALGAAAKWVDDEEVEEVLAKAMLDGYLAVRVEGCRRVHGLPVERRIGIYEEHLVRSKPRGRGAESEQERALEEAFSEMVSDQLRQARLRARRADRSKK